MNNNVITGAPGGDGQTGDAGEGTGGTDRHNLLQSGNPDENFPLPIEKVTMFDGNSLVSIFFLYCCFFKLFIPF